MCDFCIVDCKCACKDDTYSYDKKTDYYKCSACVHYINPWTVNETAMKRIKARQQRGKEASKPGTNSSNKK